MKKTILILVDGMRPDAVEQTEERFTGEFVRSSCSYLDARTVMPSVTLPCHMSLFHSVTPERHGILTNVYTPQVRPVNGLFEVLNGAGRKCAAFYNWEPLRDLGRPGSLAHSLFCNMDITADSDKKLTAAAKEYIEEAQPDFVFLYLGETDEKGHKYGWMTEEYMNAVANAWQCIRTVAEAFGEDYAIIVTADHGGHERSHGLDISEDMIIPLILHNTGCVKKENAGIMDIAPTVAQLLEVAPDRDWEGQSLL